MKTTIEIFHDLLNKFKFRTPVSADVLKYMLNTRKTVLKATLKSSGQYGIVPGLAIGINVAARNIGLRLSMSQCRIILTAILAGVTAIAATAVYLAASPLSRTADKITPAVIEEIVKVEIRADIKMKEKVPGEDIKYRLGVENFSGDNGPASSGITDKILSELKSLEGEKTVLDLRKGKNKNVNMLVVGSSRSLGGKIIITAKLVDVSKGRILLATSETADSAEDTDRACKSISKRIADHVK